MCLENIQKIKTEEDIIVYKLLERRHVGYGELVSPFYYFPWEIGKVYEMGSDEPDFFYEKIDEGYFPIEVHGHSFHTFKNLEDAQKQLKIHRDRWTGLTYVAKCRIPKNSRFIFEGLYPGAQTFADAYSHTKQKRYEGYASEKLEILEILPY